MGILNSMKLTLIFGCLIGIALGQGYGMGMTKYTLGSANPRECLTWLTTHMNADEDPSSCNEGLCECATQGRAVIPSTLGPGIFFGFHFINCTSHPYPEGYSLPEVAAMVEQ